MFDEFLVIDGTAMLYHVGGYYEGRSVLYYAPRKLLFCGDALKFEQDETGKTIGISCHKAFHKQIPLTKNEIADYLRVIGELDFMQVCSPFKHAPDVSTDDAVRLYNEQLASHRTSAQPVEIKR